MSKSQNYLLQSNFFTQSILRDVSEVQKDIIYFIQKNINFHDDNPDDVIIFNYNDFLAYKNTTKNNFYSPGELFDLCTGLITINGVFYNPNTATTEFFNLIDRVSINEENANEFKIKLASFGKIFLFKKYALEYANQSKVPYTQIESSIIDLKGEKKKKFFELLSQYKSTGIYKVSLEHLKELLGFIVYKSNTGEISSKDWQKQLTLIFDKTDISDQYERVELLSRWAEFRRVFLDPAVEDINSNPNLDISNLKYETIKLGRKVTNLHFTFQRRYSATDLDEAHKTALKQFVEFGLNERQVLYLFQRIGFRNMYDRFNKSATFNNFYDSKESKHYHRKVWFENKTGKEIQNLGGFLYEKVFPELKKD